MKKKSSTTHHKSPPRQTEPAQVRQAKPSSPSPLVILARKPIITVAEEPASIYYDATTDSWERILTAYDRVFNPDFQGVRVKEEEIAYRIPLRDITRQFICPSGLGPERTRRHCLAKEQRAKRSARLNVMHLPSLMTR